MARKGASCGPWAKGRESKEIQKGTRAWHDVIVSVPPKVPGDEMEIENGKWEMGMEIMERGQDWGKGRNEGDPAGIPYRAWHHPFGH